MQNMHTMYRILWEIDSHPTWRDSYNTITAHNYYNINIVKYCTGVELYKFLDFRMVDIH